MCLHYLGKHKPQRLSFHVNAVRCFTNKHKTSPNYHLLRVEPPLIISKCQTFCRCQFCLFSNTTEQYIYNTVQLCSTKLSTSFRLSCGPSSSGLNSLNFIINLCSRTINCCKSAILKNQGATARLPQLWQIIDTII